VEDDELDAVEDDELDDVEDDELELEEGGSERRGTRHTLTKTLRAEVGSCLLVGAHCRELGLSPEGVACAARRSSSCLLAGAHCTFESDCDERWPP
jgi:hypothetical protein